MLVKMKHVLSYWFKVKSFQTETDKYVPERLEFATLKALFIFITHPKWISVTHPHHRACGRRRIWEAYFLKTVCLPNNKEPETQLRQITDTPFREDPGKVVGSILR